MLRLRPVSSSLPVAEALGVLAGRRFVALTGAGLSTDSGIPDYRSPGRPARRPIQGPEFRRDPAVRARYWARSAVGWLRLREAAPNAAHAALAAAEARGLGLLITQNVDGLHQAAGSRRVIELHGALADVVCLGCGAVEPREQVQRRLLAANPGLVTLAAAAPDGDADVEPPPDLQVPACGACGGVLKPDVVFFGENVPAERVAAAYAAVDAAEALLVAGTSLTVWSGYRFVRRAAERGVPVVLVNRGPTRGDPLATVRVDAGVGEVLPALIGGLPVLSAQPG